MSNSVYEQYETVIGLEVHVQLATHSKAFCADDASFGGEPNTHVSAISLGHPGTLPRLNKQQAAYAVRLGLALGCRIDPASAFDRKNYFYADLPKGYQITQDRRPICVGGALPIKLGETWKEIRLHHIHMEEDAGKSIHDQDPRYSFIDLNRAGVPLLEVVTEPELRSAEEVDAFMSGMQQLVRYLGICDGNMEEGSMRCDCNVSVRRRGNTRLGERCEIKNLNSMRYARRAIAYEVKRQIDLIEAGGKVAQETLHFDPDTGVTSPLRSKEDAHDYRYFPEPDLPPVLLDEAFLSEQQNALPALPWRLYGQFRNEYQLTDYDAGLLIEDRDVAAYFQDFCAHTPHKKAAANLIINKILPWRRETDAEITNFPLALSSLAAFLQLIDEGKVSNAIAYQRLLPALMENPGKAPLALAQELELIQTADTGLLGELADQVLAANPDKVAAYKKGKTGLMGFFMGEMMRLSKGQADPKTTTALLADKLKV
ncbi:MAG: Asp-tRNA(Asn)/Glu-tRNA(Gln) amidotransferase subunit GatB [Saprospiraceae bacterium]|nr:Asp-tRNA(Asn)/Glu-tRNA(Gln) amidotransferase subunit GatB [Saprospiraceae bacterium]